MAGAITYHIVQSLNRDSSIENRSGKLRAPIAIPKQWNGSVPGHTHIQASQCRRDSTKVRQPVSYDESLETEFFFKYSINEFAVLTAGRFVYLEIYQQ